MTELSPTAIHARPPAVVMPRRARQGRPVDDGRCAGGGLGEEAPEDGGGGDPAAHVRRPGQRRLGLADGLPPAVPRDVGESSVIFDGTPCSIPVEAPY